MLKYKRIISLVPSLTELLIDLGLIEQLVGRTRFCIHPETTIQMVPIIGGTKNPNLDQILSFKPDLIIANKEENNKADVDELAQHCEVLVTEIDSISSALSEISRIGKTIGCLSKTQKLIHNINSQLDSIPNFNPIECMYFIWKDPWMSVGSDTYISDLMSKFGLTNIMNMETRYPTLSLENIEKLNPEVVLLSSEPFPFKTKHIQELSTILPNSNILLVNGEWFSWYGSRMNSSIPQISEWRSHDINTNFAS